MDKKMLELLLNFSSLEIINFFEFFTNDFKDLNYVANFFIKKDKISKQDFVNYVINNIDTFKNDVQVLDILDEYELTKEERSVVNQAFHIKEIEFDELKLKDNPEPQNIKNLFKLLAVNNKINLKTFKKVMSNYPKIKAYLKENYFEMESYKNKYLDEAFSLVFEKISFKKPILKDINDIFGLEEGSAKFLIKYLNKVGKVKLENEQELDFLGNQIFGGGDVVVNRRLNLLLDITKEDLEIFRNYYKNLSVLEQNNLAKGYFDIDVSAWKMGLSHFAQNMVPKKAQEMMYLEQQTIAIIDMGLLFFKEKKDFEPEIKTNIETLFARVFEHFYKDDEKLGTICSYYSKKIMMSSMNSSTKSRQFKL